MIYFPKAKNASKSSSSRQENTLKSSMYVRLSALPELIPFLRNIARFDELPLTSLYSPSKRLFDHR